jgi:hypothetical protein
LKLQDKQIKENLASEELEEVVLTGLLKDGMRVLFGYYDFQINHMKMHFNPVDMEKLKMAEYQIENNLPIKRELLYQVAPDFFQMELSEMKEAERRRILGQKIKIIDVSGFLCNRKE